MLDSGPAGESEWVVTFNYNGKSNGNRHKIGILD